MTLDDCLGALAHRRGAVHADGDLDVYLVAADRRFRVIHQPNMGLSAARNVGLAAATGEIVAYTDADCIVDPDWLALSAALEGGELAGQQGIDLAEGLSRRTVDGLPDELVHEREVPRRDGRPVRRRRGMDPQAPRSQAVVRTL